MRTVRSASRQQRISMLLAALLVQQCAWPTFSAHAQSASTNDAATAPVAIRNPRRDVGEKVPSDDPFIKNLHCLGLINGQVNIFRCAAPVSNIANRSAAIQDPSSVAAEAKERMKRLFDLGIRTVISYEHPLQDHNKPGSLAAARVQRSVDLERSAAAEAGLTFLYRPASNSGTNSMEDMSDEAVSKWLESSADEIFKCAKNGGVAFHCTGGHDRTGIVTG